MPPKTGALLEVACDNIYHLPLDTTQGRQFGYATILAEHPEWGENKSYK